MTQLFQDLGYPDWFRILVGLLECVGAILLVVPRLTLYSAVVLGVLMIGAIISEVLAGHLFETLLPGQWFILFVFIAYFQYKSLKRRNQKEVSQ